MRTLKICFFFAMALILISNPAQGQILKNAGKKLLNKVIGEEEEEQPASQTPNPVAENSNNNTAPQGKILTPPNVTQNLADAESYINTGNYADARYTIKQAIIGVEMEIGKQILNSLPKEVNGLSYDPSKDEVYSTGINFAGMGIARGYGNANKGLGVGIINNSAMISMYSAMLGSANYSSTNTEESQKSVNVQGNRGILKYDQGSDEYELGVPLGQTTVFILTGKRFSSEEEIMNAANKFDLASIMQMLGEQ